VHVHDWHAGLTPLLMAKRGAKLGLNPAASVATIHNLAFQGNFSLDFAGALGLDAEDMAAVEFWNQLSFLKAGLASADRITTVSHSYAQEILTPRFGCGLEGLLNARSSLLSSVPNGIDTDVWDPTQDVLIPATYTTADLKGKLACKRGLQQAFGLTPDPFAPVIAQGSRLTGQKMADTAIDAIELLLAEHPRMQFAALGTGDLALEQRYRDFAARHPGRVGVIIGYDERSAHMLHAGADMLLHGSRFEPFGLTPVYSMRYGTVPIASRVGGLIDTIKDHGPSEEPVEGATGFLFDGDSATDIAGALRRALAAFERPRTWREMQRDGMRGEYGWKASAGQYTELYQLATKGRGRGAFRLPPVQDSTAADKQAATAKKRA
jgi:starch synthase